MYTYLFNVFFLCSNIRHPLTKLTHLRKATQKWVLYGFEAPTNTGPGDLGENFNWTVR